MATDTQNKTYEQVYQYESDDEPATFGTGRFFLVPNPEMEAVDYDSDRDTRIPSDQSDETEYAPYFVEVCYDSDHDSTSERLKTEYLAMIKSKMIAE